jgi:hypothetical protein
MINRNRKGKKVRSAKAEEPKVLGVGRCLTSFGWFLRSISESKR